jgi:hypothetical protein
MNLLKTAGIGAGLTVGVLIIGWYSILFDLAMESEGFVRALSVLLVPAAVLFWIAVFCAGSMLFRRMRAADEARRQKKP